MQILQKYENKLSCLSCCVYNINLCLVPYYFSLWSCGLIYYHAYLHFRVQVVPWHTLHHKALYQILWLISGGWSGNVKFKSLLWHVMNKNLEKLVHLAIKRNFVKKCYHIIEDFSKKCMNFLMPFLSVSKEIL